MGNRNMQGKSLWRELKLIDNVPVEFGWIRALAKDRASICNNQNTQDRAKKMYLPKSEVPWENPSEGNHDDENNVECRYQPLSS